MKKWMFAAAALAFLFAGEVRADQKCTGPFCGHKQGSYHAYGQKLPVFMAAPWYLYWPYDAHFMTPAPVYGAYYAPPMMGNYPVQPYFPIPQYAPQPAANPAAYVPPVAMPPIGQ